MRQLTFVKHGLLEWKDVPEPKLENGREALVRPIVMARCDLDAPILYGIAPFRGPFPFGHEFIAEVVNVGEAMPDDLDPVAIASASDNLPDAWRTVGPYLKTNSDTNVLVVGGWAHSIGLYAVAMAVALGATQVDYADSDPERLRLAEQAGAHVIEGPPPKRVGRYGITVDASASAEGLACALRSTEPGGVCTSVGIYFRDTAVPLLEMYNTGITFVTGRVNARETIPHVLDLVRAGRFKPEQFTTLKTRWDDAPEALLTRTTKVILTRE